MAIVFLIGGTGNQFFQYAASAPDDIFSGFFLKSWVRRRLNWTDHEQAIDFSWAPLHIQTLALVLLAFDLFVARLFRFTLFSTLDLRHLVSVPLLYEINRLGYFQNAPERRALAELGNQISPNSKQDCIAVHIRGGDLLEIESRGENIYGMLKRKYFVKALELANNKLSVDKNADLDLVIITDDLEYSETLDLDTVLQGRFENISVPLKETIQIAIGADFFVASNSTLSYWIIRLRNGKNCVAPKPFQKRYDFKLPLATHRIEVEY